MTAPTKKVYKKYNDKRKKCRLSSIYFTEGEYEIFNRAMEKHGGTKKSLIMDALRHYEQKD